MPIFYTKYRNFKIIINQKAFSPDAWLANKILGVYEEGPHFVEYRFQIVHAVALLKYRAMAYLRRFKKTHEMDGLRGLDELWEKENPYTVIGADLDRLSVK